MASTAGTITVAILGDSSKFESSLSSTQKAVSVFGAAATAALVTFGAKSANAFDQAEASQNKLTFALSKSPKLFDMNRVALDDYNKSLGVKLGIDDDVIASAEAILVKYADTQKQLETLTQLTVDYARYTGKDVSDAALAVGKSINGSTKALLSLGIAYEKTGDAATDSANIQTLLNNAVQGYAEKYAQSAEGAADNLSTAFTNLSQSIGESTSSIKANAENALAGLINRVNELPDGTKQAAYYVGLLGSSAMAVVPQVIALQANLATTGKTFKSIAADGLSFGKSWGGVLTPILVGVGLAVAAIGDKAQHTTDALAAMESATNSAQKLEAVNTALQAMPSFAERALDPFGGYWTSTVTSADKVITDLGVSLTDVNKMAKSSSNEEWSAYISQVEKAAEAAGYNGVTQDNLFQRLNDVRGAAQGAADANVLLSDQEALTGTQTAETTAKIKAQTTAIQNLIDKFTILKQGFLDARSAARNYQDALDAANKAVKENGRTLDVHTKAGRANAEALDAIATSGNDVINSMVKQGASTEKVTHEYHRMRGELIDQAVQFGMTQKQAEAYVSQILKTPKSVTTKLNAITDKQEVLAYQGLIDGLDGRVIQTTLLATISAIQTASSGGKHHATGGPISGPGTGTSDSILAHLSNGEYVINARSAAKLGRANLDRLNRFADGGTVTAEDGTQVPTSYYNHGKSDAFGTKVPDKWRTDLMSRWSDKLDALVRAARDQLKELKGQRRDFAHGVSSGLMAPMTLSGTLRDGRDNDAKSLLSRYKKQAHQIVSFMKQISRLQKKGLSRTLTKELLDMGSEEGSTVARILLADDQLLGKFNRVYAQIDQSTTHFGNSMGKDYYRGRIGEARKDYKDARQDRRQWEHEAKQVINTTVHVHGSVMSEKELIKAITPKLREEWQKTQRRNRQGRN